MKIFRQIDLSGYLCECKQIILSPISAQIPAQKPEGIINPFFDAALMWFHQFATQCISAFINLIHFSF